MSSYHQSLNSGRPVQQQSHPGLAPRVDHVSPSAKSSLNNDNNNRGQQQQQSSAAKPGSATTTTTQHPLHLSEILSNSIGVQPTHIAPAGMALLSSTATATTPSLPPPMGPPLILSSGMLQQRMHHHMMINSPHTPTIFQNTKFRAGKWIPEEETYAELLIALFEKGRIAECENGTTLRSFLSQRLHCAPMRISKKYAGKGIGKMVYLSRMKPGGQEEEDDDDDKEHKALVKRVKVAEEKFYQAVFPLNDPLLGGGASFLPNNAFPLFNGGLPVFPPTQSLPFAMPPNFMNSIFLSTGGAFNNNTLPMPTLQQLKTQIQQQQQQSSQQQPSPPPQQKPAPAPIAAKPQQPNPTVPMFPAQGITVTDDASDLRLSFLRALHESDEKEKTPQDSKQQQQPDPAIENKKRIASKGGITLPKHHHHHQQQHYSTPDRTAIKTMAHELPDFLSGFEKTVKSAGDAAHFKQQAVSDTPNSEEAYSPAFTTQSFDDLHCLLGKGLPPPMELKLAAKSAASSPKLLQPRTHPPRAPEPVTQAAAANSTSGNALFTAESYAMFAQESARAASEHDAYLTGMGINVQQPKSESLDIEGMVNLVSVHVSNNQKPPPERQGHNVPAATAPSSTTTTRRNRTSISWTKRAQEEPPATTTGICFPADSTYISVVSSSEPATETESNMSSFRGSTSGSDNNTDSNSTSEGNSEGSDSEDSRKRKQAPDIIGGRSEQHYNKKTRQTQEGRQLATGTTETFSS